MTDGLTTPPSGTPVGIAAIAVHEPPWTLANDWFGAAMPRKFVHHTGIESRAISLDDEVTMAHDVVRGLARQTGCDLHDCRGIILVSPSLIPPTIAQRHLAPAAAACERPGHAARHLVRRLGLRHCRSAGLNWFCSGYSRALTVVHHRWAPRLALREGQFVIVVVASRISRITDYGCRQTGGLFGDMATATLLSPVTSRRHPVHFTIEHAHATKWPLDRPAFDFISAPTSPCRCPTGGAERPRDAWCTRSTAWRSPRPHRGPWRRRCPLPSPTPTSPEPMSISSSPTRREPASCVSPACSSRVSASAATSSTA